VSVDENAHVALHDVQRWDTVSVCLDTGPWIRAFFSALGSGQTHPEADV
jgi:hypothetical protein